MSELNLSGYRPICCIRPTNKVDFKGRPLDYVFNVYQKGNDFIVTHAITHDGVCKKGDVAVNRRGVINEINSFIVAIGEHAQDVFMFDSEPNDFSYECFAAWNLKMHQ